jgi:anaerobic dimethyl sulfoxide reductase subunit A
MMNLLPVSCNKDCGAGCPLWAHIDGNGKVVKITDNPHRPPYIQGCVKGYNMHKTLYAKDRIRTPLIRTGKRGSGRFREATWGEALDTTAQMLEKLRETYGPASLLCMSGAGACRGVVHNTLFLSFRFLGLFGGFTLLTGSYSSAAASFVTPHTFGTRYVGLDPATLLNSRFVILWGANISVTRFGCELENYLKELKRRGVPIIVIDPRKSKTVQKLATKWIPVYPGTDSAMMAAVVYVLLEESLIDRAFLERYTNGFAELESYISGGSDGVPKTPAWAEKICGTPADTIRDFALHYGNTKPAALIPGLSIQRTLGGEEAYRMAFALQAATSNTGTSGGSSGGSIWGTLPPPRMHFISFPDISTQPSLPVYKWADAILEGTKGGYLRDIKAIYSVGQNYVNQGSDIQKNIKAFEKVECAISHEVFMTPTARYCDVILPSTTFLEREDVMYGSGNYLLYSQKVADPLYESRNDYDIFCELARRLGFYNEFSENRSSDEWLAFLLQKSEVEDIEAFRSTGLYLGRDQSRVGLAEYIQDPEANPLNTPSGRIELSATASSAKGYPNHPVCRITEPPPEYPLRLITPHSPVRINSTGANLAWTEKIERKALWIHPVDAEKRGIPDGDMVRISSPQGHMLIAAYITGDIQDSVVCLPQGRWLQLNESGDEIGGSPNILTSTTPTLPSQGARTHSVFVEVTRA